MVVPWTGGRFRDQPEIGGDFRYSALSMVGRVLLRVPLRGPFQFFANLTEELSGMIVLLRL